MIRCPCHDNIKLKSRALRASVTGTSAPAHTSNPSQKKHVQTGPGLTVCSSAAYQGQWIGLRVTKLHDRCSGKRREWEVWGSALLHEDPAPVLSRVSEEERLDDLQLPAALHANAAALQTAFPFSPSSCEDPFVFRYPSHGY